MTDVADGRRGLVYLLGATGIAGVAGYVIQAVVPAFIAAEDYVTFSVYWSTVYLIVAAIAGLQQEIARAARPSADATRTRGALARYTAGAAIVVVGLTAASAPAWAAAVFGDAAGGLVPPLLAAVLGYTLVAVLSGVFYGARNWKSVAGMTVLDAALRVVAVVGVVAAGAGIAVVGWAVALPFLLSALVLWLVSGRRSVSAIVLDASGGQLARNSVSTVGAALATGVMISGLPLLLGSLAQGLGPQLLASLILVITLTRAPLVIPLLAMQSYLVVTFRDDPSSARRRTVVWSACLLVVTAVLAVAGTAVGPWVVEVLYGDKYDVPSLVYAAVIASAGFTALLCLSGPAALARGRHVRYVTGWGAASVALLTGLIVLPTTLEGVVIPLMVAPLVGAAVHLTALATPPETAREQD
ncbi:MAG: hypothetical protein K0S70_357 [Microbacterium sp.]|nr:hypothetical protein [Microbacterium sp.]